MNQLSDLLKEHAEHADCFELLSPLQSKDQAQRAWI